MKQLELNNFECAIIKGVGLFYYILPLPFIFPHCQGYVVRIAIVLQPTFFQEIFQQAMNHAKRVDELFQ